MDQISESVTAYLPSLLAAVVIMVLGTLVALALAGAVRWLVAKLNLDTRMVGWMGASADKPPVRVSTVAGQVVFWALMVMVVVAVLRALALPGIAQPLEDMITVALAFLPRLAGAVLILGIAWAVATALRFVLGRGLVAMRLDERLGKDLAGTESAAPVTVSKSLTDIVYWLVLLLFLPAVLGVLALEGLLSPVDAMVQRVLGFLPNLFSAVVILLVGWVVARIVQRIVTSLLKATRLDALGRSVGLTGVLGRYSVPEAIGVIVYILILIPAAIAALNALQLEAVSAPASAMLDQFLAAVPRLFAATVLLLLAFAAGRVLGSMATRLAEAVGFNRLASHAGLPEEDTQGRTGAQVLGSLVLVAVMLMGGLEALRLLEFHGLAILVTQLLTFAGHVLMGLVIIGIGLWLGSVARGTISSSQVDQAKVLARVAQWAIWVLAFAMGLRQMGVADEIINLAFALLLGSVAVAAAIAFGLGGRDVAARQIERWLQRRQN